MLEKNFFKIASWNVNSIKVRLEQVLDWFETNHIDILAIQETKTIDALFPQEKIQERGLFVVYSGQKTYNGMAIISRTPLTHTQTDIATLQDEQRRILAASIGPLRIINLYVPNGSAVDTEKYHYKLDWLDKVTVWLKEEMATHPHLIVLGDFNIAPENIDVHDPAEWEGSVLVSPKERAALKTIENLGLYDAFRVKNPSAQQFSWWDYRAASFRRNRGLRIDLIFITQPLLPRCHQCFIDPTPRTHPQPSDHTPVVIALDEMF